MSKPIIVLANAFEADVLIPKDMLLKHQLGEEGLTVTLSIDDATQLAEKLGERFIF